MEGRSGRSSSESEDDTMFVNSYRDPHKPIAIAFEDIKAAAQRISSSILYTPLVDSRLGNYVGIELLLKNEFLQKCGSCKERGVRNVLLQLTPDQRKKGVVCASLGNYAIAMAYHGHDLGVNVTVVMPTLAPIMKVSKCLSYEANVIGEGTDLASATKSAMRIAQEKGLSYINGYDHPGIIAGHGTIGLEILEQLNGREIDAIVVPTGGGGLLAGVAVAVKTHHPNIQIISVETERCASFARALQQKRPTLIKIESTIADGLAVPKIGCNAWAAAQSLVNKCITVKEEWVAMAILRFTEVEKYVVEGAGACGLAAVLSGELDEFKGKRIVLIVSGGNIDTTILGRCLERGLIVEGRLLKFSVKVNDSPGAVGELCQIIGSVGASIKDIVQERAWTGDIFTVDVKVTCETRNYDHTVELKQVLNRKYKKIIFDNVSEVCFGNK